MQTFIRLLSAFAFALVLSLPAQAAIITVDSSTDDGVGCTFRQAVEAANTDAAIGGCAAGDDTDDEIRFTVPTVTLIAGPVSILEALAVIGPVSVSSTAGTNLVSVFTTEPVSFVEMTWRGGRAFTSGGALFIQGAAPVAVTGGAFENNTARNTGGAIFLSAGGTLTVTGTTFTRNVARGPSATQGGGAIYTAGGAVTVESATFTDNRALGTSGSGGAILNPNGAPLTVTGSTFVSNHSQRAGGAIETVNGVTTLLGNTFAGNTAGTNPGHGGAVHGGGTADVTIVSGVATRNRSTQGGAFWISGRGMITDVSITDNIAEGSGGGGVFFRVGELTISSAPGSAASSRSGARTVFSGNRATGASGSGGALLVTGGTVTIDGATFSENRAQRAGGAIEINPSFGAMVVSMYITDALIDQNIAGRAPGNGGGLHTSAGPVVLDVDHTTFSGNEASSEGGGLWIGAGTTATVTGSTIEHNAARGAAEDNGGGGIFVDGGSLSVATSTFDSNRTFYDGVPGGGLLSMGGTVQVSQSLFVGNYASHGGGIASLNSAHVTIWSATLVQNNSRFGGAGFSGGLDRFGGPQPGFLSFDSATIASNSAAVGGGGLYNQNPPNGSFPFVTMRNTIVASNGAPNGANLKGRHTSAGWNVIGTTPDALTFTSMASDQIGTDPLLGPLLDNGGPTPTRALLAGSPAIDTGDTDLVVDQRGYVRTDGLDDVGAFEVGATPPSGLLAASASASPSTVEVDALTVVPNPFRSAARATFAVTDAQAVTVTLYDVMGRQVQQVYSGAAQAEQAIEVSVDGSSLASGVYVLVLQGETIRATRQVTVAR